MKLTIYEFLRTKIKSKYLIEKILAYNICRKNYVDCRICNYIVKKQIKFLKK